MLLFFCQQCDYQLYDVGELRHEYTDYKAAAYK